MIVEPLEGWRSVSARRRRPLSEAAGAHSVPVGGSRRHRLERSDRDWSRAPGATPAGPQYAARAFGIDERNRGRAADAP
ncbi:MAG: hypothetical protein EBZ59_02995 [Planctomycetia bacterium]|nr:hypothetical protein [Planctomycetia bacterium]